MPARRFTNDSVDVLFNQLSELSRRVNRLEQNSTPTIPDYDSSAFPDEAVHGQVIADQTAKTAWSYDEDSSAWWQIGGGTPWAVWEGGGTLASDSNMFLASIDVTLQDTSNASIYSNPTFGGHLAPGIIAAGVYLVFVAGLFFVNTGGAAVDNTKIAQASIPGIDLYRFTGPFTAPFLHAGTQGNAAEVEANPAASFIAGGGSGALGNVQVAQNSGISVNCTVWVLALQLTTTHGVNGNI